MTGAGLAAVGDATWSSRILVQQPPIRYLQKGLAASYSQQGAKNNGEQTKDTVLFSVKGCSTN